MDVEFQPTGWLPDFAVLRGLLAPEECRQVIQASHETAYPATRINAMGELQVDTGFRNCHTSHFKPGDPTYELIVSKLLPHIETLNANYQFELFPEVERMIPVINVNRYADGGRIRQHTDVGGYEHVENCKLSISILLNEDFIGGDFFVFGGKQEYPLAEAKAGDLCVFPSFMVHAVGPVIEGARYTAIIWLRGPRFR